MRKSATLPTYICLVIWLCIAGAQAAYEPLDLGTLGGAESWALDVNTNGSVVGCSLDSSGRQRAFLWTEPGGMTDIGTLGGESAAALSINDFGEIVGYSDTADGKSHAFLRTTAGEMVDLGLLPDHTSSQATAAANVIVGFSVADGRSTAFSWNLDDGMVVLPPLVAGANTRAYGVNSDDDAVGAADNSAGQPQAVLWRAGSGAESLGTLGGNSSWACGINDAGVVVGQALDASGKGRAFVWTAASGIRPMAGFRSDATRANAVNNLNQAAGSAQGARRRPVVWELGPDVPERFRADAAVLPLLKGCTEGEANSIGDSGLVAGYCTLADGSRRAVLWKPKDEPTTALALLGGVSLPISSDARDKYDDVWWRASLTTYEKVRLTRPHLTWEGGYYYLKGISLRARLYPITVGVEKGFEPSGSNQSYVALRGGPYYARVRDRLAGTEDTGWGLNLNASYGMIFDKNLFLEFRFDYFSEFADTDFSNFSVSLGYRLFDL